MELRYWGTMASEKQICQMQVVHNSVMRWICGVGRETRTRDLLRMSGMMSIRQLIMYTVLMAGLVARWIKSPITMSQWSDEKERKLQIT